MVFGLFKKKEPVKVTVKGSGETFMCEPNELLMKAALRQNIAWPCSCKVGSCGSCRATITEGEGKYPSSPCDPTALLKKDEIDVNSKNIWGYTALKLAKMRSHTDIAAALRTRAITHHNVELKKRDRHSSCTII